jgi:hypothetical protein
MGLSRQPGNSSNQRFEYSLLENGLDFIWSALELLGSSPNQRQLKYAVLHLSSGVELVLKERLLREHWSLVFDKPENANRNKYEAGDFTSVSFHACIKRLIEICSITISDDQKKRITSLRDKRNRLEHFGIVDTVEALTSDAAAALGFIIDFVDLQLSSNLSDAEKTALERIRKRLSDFSAFVQDRLASLAETLASSSYPVKRCPSCDQKALVVGRPISCVFCHYTASPNTAANEYIAEILHEVSEDWPLYLCPHCSELSLVDEGYQADTEYICFSCGKTWNQANLQSCDTCGRLHDGEKPTCTNCDLSRQLPNPTSSA